MSDSRSSGVIKEKFLPWLLKVGRAAPRRVYRCTEEEVAALEETLGSRLPDAYREFLLVMGHGAGNFWIGTDAFYGHLPRLREWAAKLLAESGEGSRLPEDAFVFSMHQGYHFLYFCLSEGEDPPVYSYLEGDGKPCETGLTFIEYLLSSVVETTTPLEDLALAADRDLRFKVSQRRNRLEPWQDVRDNIPSMRSAMAVALEASRQEVIVWVQRKDGAGVIRYWASSDPRFFNSKALQEG